MYPSCTISEIEELLPCFVCFGPQVVDAIKVKLLAQLSGQTDFTAETLQRNARPFMHLSTDRMQMAEAALLWKLAVARGDRADGTVQALADEVLCLSCFGRKDLQAMQLLLTCSFLALEVSPAMGGTASCGCVDLRTAQTYGVLAGSTITNTGTTNIYGDLGLWPGTSVTGAPTVNGETHINDAAAAQAQLDLTAAYLDAQGRTTPTPVIVAGNIGGQTFTPGIYKSTSSLAISSGDVTLDANGDPDACWIFQIATTLITSTSRKVILIDGAQAKNVFWQVGSSATLGANSILKGSILALTAITMVTEASVDGRVLARNAAVTMDTNSINVPSCV